jgi:general secretion pathway protein G
MRATTVERQSGFTFFEFVVSMVILLVLTGVMLSRIAIYQAEAEKLEVEQLVETVRMALNMRISNPVVRRDRTELQKLADGNPLDLLQRKPPNYVGEYYSPELKKIPAGNWVFDRRDKCLIYLVKSTETSTFHASKFLKFKVEFEHAQMPGGKNGATEAWGGMTVKQIDNQPS